jgi:hypothetical protein
MTLKGLLWLLCVPGAFWFGISQSRAIYCAAAVTGCICWTVTALLVIANVISSSSRTSRHGTSSWWVLQNKHSKQ